MKFYVFFAIFFKNFRNSFGIFDVAIVGAGAAGLSAARIFMDLIEIFNITLFEANFDRIGGRILSQNYTNGLI